MFLLAPFLCRALAELSAGDFHPACTRHKSLGRCFGVGLPSLQEINNLTKATNIFLIAQEGVVEVLITIWHGSVSKFSQKC